MLQMESTHAGTRTTTSMEAGEAASRELKCAVREVVGSAMGHLGTRRHRSCEEVLAQLPLLDNSFYWYASPKHSFLLHKPAMDIFIAYTEI